MPTETTGLTDLVDALRRRWTVALAVLLPMLVGVVLYVQTLPDEFDGEAIVAFSAAPGDGVSADVIRLTVPKYEAYITAPATSRIVAQELSADAGELDGAVTATTAPDTPTMRVVVRLGDAERAARAANAFAEEAVRFSRQDAQLRGTVLAPALVPEEPASPPRRLLIAGGLVLALLSGITLAVVVDRSRPRVLDPLSLALATGHGTVGRVPRSRMVRRAPLADVLADPAIGTAVRAMRTQLEQQSRQIPVKVVAVTSPMEGDGKTTVAALLAAALARVDASVLIVDADLRRPRLGAALNMPSTGPGLAELLEGSATMDAAARLTPLPGLSIVTTTRRNDAGDLIARRLHAVLLEARERYDVVVLDCPPVLATDDSRTIALIADGTLLVVSSGSDSAKATSAAAALDSLGVRVLGAVLNRSRRSGRGDLGSYGAYGSHARS